MTGEKEYWKANRKHGVEVTKRNKEEEEDKEIYAKMAIEILGEVWGIVRHYTETF